MARPKKSIPRVFRGPGREQKPEPKGYDNGHGSRQFDADKVTITVEDPKTGEVHKIDSIPAVPTADAGKVSITVSDLETGGEKPIDKLEAARVEQLKAGVAAPPE